MFVMLAKAVALISISGVGSGRYHGPKQHQSSKDGIEKLEENKRPVSKRFTSSGEGQVISDQVHCKKVLLEVLPYIGFVGDVAQEGTSRLLMVEVEEPHVVVVGIGLKIEQVVVLMRRRDKPLFMAIKDIECRNHSIPI